MNKRIWRRFIRAETWKKCAEFLACAPSEDTAQSDRSLAGHSVNIHVSKISSMTQRGHWSFLGTHARRYTVSFCGLYFMTAIISWNDRVIQCWGFSYGVFFLFFFFPVTLKCPLMKTYYITPTEHVIMLSFYDIKIKGVKMEYLMIF